MKTLLTGFGAFLDVTDNPSARLVHRFGESGAPGHDITARVLPVSCAAASEVIPALMGQGFDAAILLGVAARDTEVRLERFARNDRNATPDVDGFAKPGPIFAGGPDCYETRIPLEPLLSGLTQAGLPARISEDAGAYVCNHTYYTAMHAIALAGLPTLCLFVHVPPATPDYPLAMQAAAIGTILEALRVR
ncbi:MAG TPA: pyroglutamyl-peptidase I [Armatimonadota bacterium]|jgi:pyroglutamyl-peptidase